MSDGLDLGEEFDIDVQSMEIEERSYDPVPDGEYLMQLDKSEEKDTKAGGKMLKGTFRILDGEYENRLIFQNYNIKNSNSDAVRIAVQDLGRLCKAVGAETIRYPEAYTHKPFIGKVRTQESKNPQYPDQNIIVEYYPLDHAQAPEPPKQVGPKPAARPAPASGQSNAASAGKSRPWDKKAS